MDLWNRSDSPAPPRAPTPVSPPLSLSPPPRGERRYTSGAGSRFEQNGKGNSARSSSVPSSAARRQITVNPKEAVKSQFEGHQRPRSLYVHDNHRNLNWLSTEMPPVPVSFILAEAEAQANMSAMLLQMHATQGHKHDARESSVGHPGPTEGISSLGKWSSNTSLDNCSLESSSKTVHASSSVQNAEDSAGNDIPTRRRRTLRRKHRNRDEVLVPLSQDARNFDRGRQQNVNGVQQSEGSTPQPKSTHRPRSGFAGVLSSPIRSLMAMALPSGASRPPGRAR